MLQKYGQNISLVSIFLGIGLLGLWLLTSNSTAGLTTNTILVRSTGGLPPVQAADTRPGNILQKAGIHLFPGDRILVDGQIYKPDQPLIAADNRVIQIIPAARITIRQNEKQIIFSSSASTLGQALWKPVFVWQHGSC